MRSTLIVAIAIMSIPANAAARELRIADWNIDKGKHLSEIVQALRALSPNICILQEVDRHARRTGGKDIASKLAASLRMNYVFGEEFQELGQSMNGERALEGQAILSSLPVLRSRVLKFQHQSNFWKPSPLLPNLPFMQRRMGGRIGLIAELDAGGRRLVVYNLHLESRSLGHLQYSQLEEVLADAKRYPAGTPIVIAGDFNTKYRQSPFVRRLERDDFRNCLGKSQRRTHILIGTLDWIFANGKVEVKGGEVHQNVKGSDHYPLTADLAIE